MSKIRLKALLSSALLIQFAVYVGEKFVVPLYAPDVVQKMQNIQHYIHRLEYQISMEGLEANPRFSAFMKSVSDRAKQHVHVGKPSMIIMAAEGTFPWIQNLACSVAEYDMLTRISVVTIDHETTLSIGLEFPMMPVCELNFDEFLEDVPPSYEEPVRRRMFDILRLRIGAVMARKELDVLIAAPNQVWTSYLLNRTLYLFRAHQDRESLLVQKLEPHNENSDLIDSSSFIVLGRFNPEGWRVLEKSARLMSRKFITADSALTYACDVPERFICRRLSSERMAGSGWFRGKRKVVPDIVHLPMKTKISTLSEADLWLLSDGGICLASLRENLMLSLLYSNPDWEGGLPVRPNTEKLRMRFRPPHPAVHRSFLEESGVTDL